MDPPLCGCNYPVKLGLLGGGAIAPVPPGYAYGSQSCCVQQWGSAKNASCVFNRCGLDIQMWKPSLVKVTGDVLQDAWRFRVFLVLFYIQRVIDNCYLFNFFACTHFIYPISGSLPATRCCICSL